MNRKELEAIRKENSYKIDRFRLSHSFGCVRINTHNSLKHETAKLKKAYELMKEGHIIATEVFSINNERKFDCFDFDTGEVIEIIKTSEPKLGKEEKRITVRI